MDNIIAIFVNTSYDIIGNAEIAWNVFLPVIIQIKTLEDAYITNEGNTII